MTVTLDKKVYSFDRPMLVKRIFEEIGIDSQSYLAIDGKRLLTHDVTVGADQDIRIVRVVSGG